MRPARRRQRVLDPMDSRAPIRRAAHGLTPTERDALVRLQGGRCAICLSLSQRLQVDHDHRHCPGRTGCRRCIRGMLCHRCNSALGWIGDQHIERLMRYLAPRP